MKLIFFGTGDFAVPTLRALHATYGSELVQVVTQPDRPVGRLQQLQATPVKQAANQLGIPVIHDFSALQAADVAVVVYYGVILPQTVLENFSYGMLNIHPSLLPRWRGPSPIRSALLADDVVTGVTVMRLDAGMDTGPILKQVTVPITDADTNVTLETKLATMGADLLVATLPAYLAKAVPAVPQTTKAITISKLIRKADGELTPDMTPRTLWNRYRALQPWPGVFFMHDGKRFKITAAHWEQNRFICDAIQPEGKQAMPVADFKRGYPQVLFADII